MLLFGPTDPEIWAPPNEGVVVMRAPQGELAELAAADVVGLVESRVLL